MATANASSIAAIASIMALFGKLLLSMLGPQVLFTSILLLAPIFYQKKWYRWFYIIYKTLPRDFVGSVRFVKLNIDLYTWERKKMSVPVIFRNLAKKHPNKNAFLFEDTKWTYAQVEEYSNKISHYFKKQGFQRGDTIALFMESRVEYICTWLGLSKIGVVTALINSNLRKYPLVHSLTVSSSKAVIIASELSHAIKDICGDIPDMKFYQFNEKDNAELIKDAKDLKQGLKDASSEPLLEEIEKCRPKDKLLYVYTSGTTGLPKAAVITNIRYMFMVSATYNMLGLSRSDIIYDSLPLYHSAGGIVGAGQSLLQGVTVALRKKFSASNFWKDCIKYNCSCAQYIGEICRYLLAVPSGDASEKNHRVKKMFGNGLRPQIWTAFTTRFGIRDIGEFYGATEGNSNIVNFDGVPGAVGFKPRYINGIYPIALIRFNEITGEPLRDERGFCIACRPNEPGIFIGRINPRKAVSDFAGYTDKNATNKKVLMNVFKKGDCFFNSGDILVMDELGYFFFKDRTGDTFRWRGENVATSEVEAVISNVVKLHDAVVYGVEVPNTEGKCGMVAIVDPDDSLDLDALRDGLVRNLPTYACPLFVRVMKEVPLTGTFKLKKVDLQNEGYDPRKLADKLYFYDAKVKKFVTLTEELFDDIHNGKIRL